MKSKSEQISSSAMKCLVLAVLAALLLTRSFAASEDYDFVVAQDGTGNFTTIQAAIYAVRDFKPGERAVILIRNGIYHEKVVIPTYKCNILLQGEDAEKTVVVCNDYAALNSMGTFKTYTLLVAGNDIEIANMTVSNTAGRVGAGGCRPCRGRSGDLSQLSLPG